MKNRITYLMIFVLLIMLPISVSANIMCNDGTMSPSCQDCHRGCCSHHGGCTNSPTYNDSNYNSYVDEGNYSKNNVIDSDEEEIEKYENEDESYYDEIIDEDYSYDNHYAIIDDETDEEEDDDNGKNFGGLAILSVVGYLIYKKKQK